MKHNVPIDWLKEFAIKDIIGLTMTQAQCKFPELDIQVLGFERLYKSGMRVYQRTIGIEYDSDRLSNTIFIQLLRQNRLTRIKSAALSL